MSGVPGAGGTPGATDTPGTGGTPDTPRGRGAGAWALSLAVVALGASFFVGWTLPIGAASVVLSVIALRRGGVAVRAGWALALSILAVVYSTGWIVWTLTHLPAG